MAPDTSGTGTALFIAQEELRNSSGGGELRRPTAMRISFLKNFARDQGDRQTGCAARHLG
jgi:hypothetical protein